MGIKKTRSAKERHAMALADIDHRNRLLQQSKGLYTTDNVELSRKQRLALLNAGAVAVVQSELLPSAFKQSTEVLCDEDDIESLDPIVDAINFYAEEVRPGDFVGKWPVNNFVVQRPIKSLKIAESFVLEGLKVVWLVRTNRDAIDAEEEFHAWHPDVEVRRYVSKAQNLIQRLLTVGVQDFQLTYKGSKSPYALGDLDARQTLLNLRSALDIAGAQHIDEREVFQQEYEDYKFGPMGDEVDVMIFTFAKFNASILPHKKPWWDREGLGIGERTFDWQGVERTASIGPDNLIVIWADPPPSEFDECRLIKPEYVDDLQAVRKRVTKRQLSYAHPGYFEAKGYERDEAVRLSNLARDRIRHAYTTAVHHIIELNGDHFEVRPESMMFPMCLRQGYGQAQHGLMPKALVLTYDNDTARDAYREMSMNNTNWYKVVPEIKDQVPKGTLIF